jgi:hypothetical protein
MLNFCLISLHATAQLGTKGYVVVVVVVVVPYMPLHSTFAHFYLHALQYKIYRWHK